MARVFLSLVAVFAIVAGLAATLFGFVTTTQVVTGGAVMVSGAILFLSGVVIASAVEIHAAISETREYTLKLQVECRDLLKATNDQIAHTNKLIEWTGEIQGETLRFQKKGAPEH